MSFYPARVKFFYFLLMGKAVKLISRYLSADISDVLNSSTYYCMCPHSADYFHVLLNWKEDQIMSIYFYGKANAT